MKYIIELPDNCQWVQWINLSDKDGHAYFDFKSPEDLTPFGKELLDNAYQKGLEEGKKQAKVQAHLDVCHDIERVAHGNYQKGLDDAWEMAKRIVLTKTDANCPYFTIAELEKIFGCSTSQNVLCTYSASEAIEKLKAYEQQKADEIKVGDEVTPKSNNSNWLGVVVGVDDTDAMVMTRDGYTAMYRLEILKKTDKHFPQMAELLNAMKGEQEKVCATCKYIHNILRCNTCYDFNKWESKEVTK